MKLLTTLALAAVLLTYSNHFDNGFHFDDFHSIVNNPAIRDLKNFPRFFTDAGTISVLPANRAWRPVVVASWAFDYWRAGGLKPVAFHTSTFLWFLLLLALIFVLFRSILVNIDHSPANYTALFATTLFGLHPAMAETVNYICQRGDVYVALGIVAGLTLYIVKPALRRYGLYLIPVALALLAKPPALVFAPILFAWLWLFVGDSPARTARASAPSFALVGAILWLHSVMTPKSFAPSELPAFNYIVTQPYVAFRAFRTFFLPLWLSADTDLKPFQDAAEPAALLGFVFIAALLVAIAWTSRRLQLRPIAFGLVWFLLGLLPTALFPLSEVENDHRLFLPFIGLSLTAAWSAALVLRRLPHPRAVAPVAALILLALCARGTWARNEVWRTEESLWRDVTIKSPANGRGLMNYGVALMAAGNLKDAARYFERALPFTPNYSLLHINLGVVYGALGRAAEADRHFATAISLAPNDPGSYVYYGRWLAQAGRRPEAIAILRTALTKDGDHAEAPFLLASLTRDQPDPVDAAKALAERDPTPENFLNLSLELHRARRYPEEIAAAQEAIRRRPAYAEAWNNIAAAWEELHDWDKAIDAATRAIRIDPGFALARNNLAWAQQQKKLAH